MCMPGRSAWPSHIWAGIDDSTREKHKEPCEDSFGPHDRVPRLSVVAKQHIHHVGIDCYESQCYAEGLFPY